MGVEIERKFLVDVKQVEQMLAEHRIRPYPMAQAYFFKNENINMRVRITENIMGDDVAVLCIKGRSGSSNVERSEFEYTIPVADAQEMIVTLPNTQLSKTRFIVPAGNHSWEIDFFDCMNGLVVAEIELSSIDEQFDIPSWVTEEVTDDVQYLNQNLAT